MDPISLLLMTGGTGMQAYGSIYSGEAGNAAATYNARIAEGNAVSSRQQAAIEEQKVRVQAKKHLGDMRAGYGASGVQVDGSILDILAESAATAELDALTVKWQGEMKARQFENEARVERFRGRVAKQMGYMGAVSSLTSGAANLYSKRG